MSPTSVASKTRRTQRRFNLSYFKLYDIYIEQVYMSLVYVPGFMTLIRDTFGVFLPLRGLLYWNLREEFGLLLCEDADGTLVLWGCIPTAILVTKSDAIDEA